MGTPSSVATWTSAATGGRFRVTKNATTQPMTMHDPAITKTFLRVIFVASNNPVTAVSAAGAVAGTHRVLQPGTGSAEFLSPPRRRPDRRQLRSNPRATPPGI